MLEKNIHGYDVALCFDVNIENNKLPYKMEREIYNTLFHYVSNNELYNKARAFEYLQKILYADLHPSDEEAFLENFFSDKKMMIAYAGAVENYIDGNYYIIVAFHDPNTSKFNICNYETYNEGNVFDLYEYEENEREAWDD